MKRLARGRDTARHGPRPRPGQPAGTDLLPQIRHIVVLMMENHSYDSYLGMLSGRGGGFPLAPDGQPDVFNKTAGGETIRAFPQSSPVQRHGVPSQSWHACHQQWGEGKCDGFVTSAESVQAEARAGTAPDGIDTAPEAAAVGLGYWSERDLPFYYGLARTFPLADHWFSSCLGPTFANRRFLIAGTAHGLIDDSPCNLLDYPPAGTIFDLLTEHGISWANYHPVAGEQPRWRHYARHTRKMARRRLMSAGRALPHGVQKDIQFTADVFPLGIGRYMQHVRGLGQFFADAAQGGLPAFSLVDPDFGAYSEENPQDIRKGESFAAGVVNAVLRGAGWPHTLLIWMYDEHGGYYDHVPPPPAVPPDDVEGGSLLASRNGLTAVLRRLRPRVVESNENLDQGPRRYDRYGFRVPAVFVSPYARPGYVSSEIFDHTSMLKLVEEKWNLPALTARDAAARAPLDALDLAGAPSFLEPPVLPEPSLRWGSWLAAASRWASIVPEAPVQHLGGAETGRAAAPPIARAAQATRSARAVCSSEGVCTTGTYSRRGPGRWSRTWTCSCGAVAVSLPRRRPARPRCPGPRGPAGLRRSAGPGWPGWPSSRTGRRRRRPRSAG